MYIFIGRKQDKAIDANREAVAQLNNEVLEVIEGIRVTRAYSKKQIKRLNFKLVPSNWLKVGIASLPCNHCIIH